MKIIFKQNYSAKKSLEFRLNDFSKKMNDLSFTTECESSMVFFKRFPRPVDDISDKLSLIRLIQFSGQAHFENDNFARVCINLNRQVILLITGITLSSIVFFLINGLNLFIPFFWLISILIAILISCWRAISIVKSCL